MKKEKLIKVLDFLGDLLDSTSEVVSGGKKDKLFDDLLYPKEKSTPVNGLMDNAKENFNRVINSITESDKPASLDYEAKEQGLKQLNKHDAIKMVIEQYITDSHDTNTIVYNVLGRIPSVETSRALRLFIKNTWDVISKLENGKLIDKTKLAELKEQHTEGFMIESNSLGSLKVDKLENSDSVLDTGINPNDVDESEGDSGVSEND